MPTGRGRPLTLEVHARISVGIGLAASQRRGAMFTLAGLEAIQVVRNIALRMRRGRGGGSF